MTITRRQFLLTFAGATAIAAGVGIPFVLNYVEQIRLLPLPDIPPGPMDDVVRETMRAVITTIFVNFPVDADRYEQYLVYHAEKINGYGKVYQDFVTELNRDSAYTYSKTFVDCNERERRFVLAPWLRMPITRDERLMDGFGHGIFSLQVSQHIFRELLTMFMNTDAWIAVGYEAWPGMPRGLDNYTQPLSSL
ncbi:MAG: hypothetical protein H6671_00835 [Anaerolineaceae bacterium]|nr:hypothetical protein [Anaerolineaceae bacterium]